MLPAILGAISIATELFDVGKDVYETVTGEKSSADSPESLANEVSSLPADKQALFNEKMEIQLERYRAETERLKVQGGLVDAETLSSIPEKQRGEIAYTRMTARPKIAMRMAHVILFPVYIAVLESVILLHNLLQSAYSSTPTLIGSLASQMLTSDAPFVQLYAYAGPTAASVVITYMGLREIGKRRGNPDEVTVKGLAGKVSDLFKKVVK